MKRYTMTQEQYDKILDASKPVLMIMLQCGNPPSPQENANRAWKRLGDELGFNHMTARPVMNSPMEFDAQEKESS